MRAIFLYIIILLNFINFAKAQELTPTVIATGGYSSVSGQYGLSYTIGQIMVPCFKSNKSTFLSQGFNQPSNIVIRKNKESKQAGISVKSYPNPTVDKIRITVANTESTKNEFIVKVFDLTGRVLNLPVTQSFSGLTAYFDIDLNSIAGGQYLVKIYSKDGLTDYQTVRLIKKN